MNTMKQIKFWVAGASMLTVMAVGTPWAWAGEGLLQSNAAANPRVATAPPLVHDTDATTHRSEIRSSVQVSRDTIREAVEASRQAYTAKLQKYAKCSARDAEKAVAAAHPGMKVEHVQLRTIRTNLVYMALAEDDDNRYLVVVDAGNGKILLDKPLPTHHERVFAEH